MLPRIFVVVMLFLLMSAPALGQKPNAFEFPPTEAPPVIDLADLVPPAVVIETVVPDAGEKAPRDWAAFLENFLIPLISVIVGLFGGGLGVRFNKKRVALKAKRQAETDETRRILRMLSSFVPQLHGKVVLGDDKSRKLNAALAKAKEALDEAVNNGG